MLLRLFNPAILFVFFTLFGVTACGGSTEEKLSNKSQDQTAPVLSLNGKALDRVAKGQKYIDLGATALDDVDGKLKVSVSGKVNTARLGEYTLTYSATDRGGNRASLKRTVTVETWYKNLHPYQQSDYSDQLKGCVSATAVFSCTLLKLPFIGQKSSRPSEKEIMDRVIVSHQWMGDRFKQVLAKLPEDIKLLLRSVTAIVIDDDIRPAYYWIGTGAIYLDPDFFWLTNKEKENIAKDEDKRAAYGNGLAFMEWWLLTKNHRGAYNDNDGTLYNQIERQLTHIIMPVAELLYHELAHANDFAPYNAMANLDKTSSIYNVLYAFADSRKNLSSGLWRYSPLHSKRLSDLAKVRFKGNKASSEQKNMKADYVGALFSADSAVVHYSYNSPFEDFSNLFTASMMKYHYDLEIDHAFINKVNKEETQCTDYLVGWGTRNRIANALVRPRARYVVNSVFPEQDWRYFFETSIGIETPKIAGQDWCRSLGGVAQQRSATPQTINIKRLTRSPHSSPFR
ncbi:MAG: DUF5011 domain-containing protein [Cocleimonas sp.]|nr:DUF5011 domain-containing protein [Cocleimonas sp.]